MSGTALFNESKLIDTVNPGTRQFLTLPGEHPWLSRLFLGMMLGIMSRIAPSLFVRNAASMLPQPDRALVSADPAFQQGFIRMVRDALRQGSHSAHREALLTLTGCGFKLQQIQTALYLWHEEADQNIPVEMDRHLATAVPGYRAEIYPNEGHLSLFKKYAEHILGALIDPDS